MSEQLNEMQRDIKDVKEALLGSEYGATGLVKRLGKVEKYQTADRKSKWTLAGIVIAVSAFFKYGDKINW